MLERPRAAPAGVCHFFCFSLMCFDDDGDDDGDNNDDGDEEYTNLYNLCFLLFLFIYSSLSISFSFLPYLTIHYHHPHHLGVSLADAGLKTLLVSTDPAHSLGDCVSLPLTGSPTLLAPANEMGGAYPGDPSADGASLWGMEINPKEALNEFKVMIKEAMGNAEGAMGGSGGAGGMGAAMGLPDLKQELTNLLDMENLEDTPGV